jgi:hypothetical protein
MALHASLIVVAHASAEGNLMRQTMFWNTQANQYSACRDEWNQKA